MYKLRKYRILKALSRLMACYGIITFMGTSAFLPTQSYAQSSLNLPAPGSMLSVSDKYCPTIMRGLTIYPDDPLQFDFIIDTGDDKLKGQVFNEEAKRLIKYFLTSLTVPEDELWVNLSPYEEGRIIPQKLGVTDMGIDMLAQDYILKQLTASLIYPEDDLGGEFWEKVYAKAKKIYGTDDIPVDTLNKVWIVPDAATVYEHDGSVFVVERHLKVMLEEDYLALQKNLERMKTNSEKKVNPEELSRLSSEIIKEVILPEIEKEVNEGKNFAKLRQMYNSMILATWYKKNLKEGLLGQIYVNKNKVRGVDAEEKEAKEKVYQRYLEAFKKGVYNFIKEDYDEEKKKIIPRKYFSGGLSVGVVTSEKLQTISGELSAQPTKVSSAVVNPESAGEDRKVTCKILEADALEQFSDAQNPVNVMLTSINHVRDSSKADYPLGITTLAGNLKYYFKDSVSVGMAHHLVEGGVTGIIERIKKDTLDILGFSLGFGSLSEFIEIMEYINSLETNKRPMVIVGNVVATYNVDFLLEKFPDILIGVGLGEEAMEGAVRFHNGEIKKDEIPNIVYTENGEIKRTKVVKNTIAKGLIPPDILRSVVQSGGVVYMETSRGCPFNCAICDRKSFLGGGWRGPDIDEIVDDIAEVSKYGVRNINFVDEDLFAGGVDRAVELAEKILSAKKEGLIPEDLIFGTSASVRQIFRKKDGVEDNTRRIEAFKRLREAGLRVLFIGIESGSPKQLRRYGKAATVEENEEAIRLVEEVGICVIPGFIMMDPLVTPDEIRDNIAFLRRTGMDARITYPLKTYIPLKESRLTKMLISEGLVDVNSYMPDRLAYDKYFFKNERVAEALRKIKDWEDSQAMFFWELKIIFRSSNFGQVSESEKLLIRELVDEQTRILLDYLDELINLSEEEVVQEKMVQEISVKYGHRLIRDMLGVLIAIEEGRITLGGEELKNIIHRGMLREVIRLYYLDKGFSLSDVQKKIQEVFGYSSSRESLQKALDVFEEEGRVEFNSELVQFFTKEKFSEYRDIPWPDLPRPSLESKERVSSRTENLEDANETTETTSSPIENARVEERKVGGIDFSPTMLDLRIKRDVNGVPLALSQQAIYDMKVDGFIPVIINVTPINIPILMDAPEDVGNRELITIPPKNHL